MTPVLLIGAGAMGGAMVAGWMRTGALAPAELMIRDPSPGSHAQAAIAAGAMANPPDGDLAQAETVVLAVKPQVWRDTAAAYAPLLRPRAVLLSVVAGVRLDQLDEAFPEQRAARVMPITAVATGAGVATLVARDPDALARAHALFDPIAATVALADEALMDAATAVSGSAPAYLYAFTEALEAAGAKAGLPLDTAQTLARATMASAARLMQESGEDPAELRRQVTSPKGVTLAALEVLMADDGLGPLLERAVQAAIARSREIAG
jgi:pyrroline-5-carboxylate reductase